MWGGNSPNEKYLISLSKDGGKTWEQEIPVTGTDYTFKTLTAGTYKWRIKADNNCSNDWKEGEVFTVKSVCVKAIAPTNLNGPSANSCTFSSWSFTWDGAADVYEIIVSNNAEHNPVCPTGVKNSSNRRFSISNNTLTTTCFDYNSLTDLDDNGKKGSWHNDTDPSTAITIYWKVRAKNTCDGTWSAWVESTFSIKRDSATCCNPASNCLCLWRC